MRGRIGDRDPVLLDRTVRPDQRRGTDRPLNGLALSVFPWPPGAVGFHDSDLWVGQQRIGQVELGNELIVRIDPVSTDTENDCVGLCYGLNSVAEPARFFGSARGIVLGIKPKHDVFPGVVGQRMLLAIAAFQGKRRSLLSFKSCHCDSSVIKCLQCLSHSSTIYQSCGAPRASPSHLPARPRGGILSKSPPVKAGARTEGSRNPAHRQTCFPDVRCQSRPLTVYFE